ncbi:NADH-dependent flavin oxidoreductase [Staphylococcus equorum]|uniref:NADH-dependent flavin oxidoreductase n=1 Tax=Staphylococcus equorum TaxID=246432 RepID=UPI00398007C8
MSYQYEELFQVLPLANGVKLKNRIIMAPMSHYSSNEDGSLSKSEIAYIDNRSNGPSMVITACAYVQPNGKGFQGEPAVDRDNMIEELQILARTIKQNGAKAILQLHHAGRTADPKVIPNEDVVAPSAIPKTDGDIIPRELKDVEIKETIKNFGESTRRAIEAGFDGVEIHGANGYLIQQFYSPHSNRRNDYWGGQQTKRLRFPMQVIDEVKRVVNQFSTEEFIVGYRFTPEEPMSPGLTMDDAITFIDNLVVKKLDYIHILLNDYRTQGRRGTQIDDSRLSVLSKRVPEGIPVMSGGNIYTPEEAINALEHGANLVSLAKTLILNPKWVDNVKNNKKIKLFLESSEQDKLVIPNSLWEIIWNTPGWFPTSPK